jgi:hypothetical protein
MFPDLFDAIGTTYGAGDGSTTFNVPDYNAAKRFAQGDTVAGVVKQAGLPNIEGTGYGSKFTDAQYTGALIKGQDIFAYSGTGTYGGVCAFSFDASQANSIYGSSDTVQPKSLTCRYIIKAYDGVTPTPAEADISEMLTELTGKADRDLDNLSADGENHFLEQDFTIIYPNGGTEASPANITVNSRYVETNPFPGYHVMCDAEILINNQWGSVQEFIYSTTGYGIKANQFNDSIIVQTGSSALTSLSALCGNPFGITTSPATTLPCRVKVWKIGKIPTE